jgi:SAM-dependent methyltransferase
MSTTIALEALKQANRRTWASGDYSRIAELVTDIGERVADRAGIRAGGEVLDVAAGTGNAAIPAAQAGAQVIASDLTPELFVVGRRRTAEAGVAIEWITADAEDLPFDDGRFDYVLSSLGVQFAPRHEVVASELVRVCRPGGCIALCNWTPEGQVGEMLSIIGRYMPPPPPFASPPPRWGDEGHVRRLFGDVDADIELEFVRGTTPWRYDSADAYVAFKETTYGPMIAVRARLEAEGRWDECRAALVEMMERRNVATDGSLLVHAEYAIAVARKG